MPRTITLIEDDIDAAVILKKILLKAGYRVNVLPEGSRIVEGDFEIPDIFILDNYMPAIHGVALCKFLKLKSRTAKVPVIIISGSMQIEKKAKAAGASAFLCKPFNSHQLVLLVEQAFILNGEEDDTTTQQ
jgi:DNA-binding response OmpR family regulator